MRAKKIFEELDRAEWYDRTIDWESRIRREIPVLEAVLGRPGSGGILDAGCGTGHQAAELAARGYLVTAVDSSEEMLAVARRVAGERGVSVRHVVGDYEHLVEIAGWGFDGIYCIGNSLAAAASREKVRGAIEQFGRALRMGGRLFVQVLNFAKMRGERPCVRGPRVTHHGGTEIVSTREFHFEGELVQVTNLSVWKEEGWRMRAQARMLYPVTAGEMGAWCQGGGMEVASLWGSYGREEFDEGRSEDLIVVAEKRMANGG